ncbi:hypothetical protein K492DRAFT_190870 [Lichtheimia hyalospora FSU 10163]|nr:hypothetical protein K492DRAFT_190870 [Lichtheimia hyalospora FSU 10163]
MSDAFSSTWNCEDEDILREHYGRNLTASYQHCILDHQEIHAARIYFAIGIVYAAFVIFSTIMFVVFATSGIERPYYQYAMLSATTAPSTISTRKRRRLQRMKLLHRWKRNNLRKRSIFGTTLGAIGNLVFCTSVFMSQAFYNDSSCEVYLWGVCIGFYTWFFAFFWRAYRLWFLIRLNDLKARFGGDVLMSSSASMTTSHSDGDSISLQNDKDYKWFMKNKDGHLLNISRPLVLYILFLIVIIIVCAVIEARGFRSDVMECEGAWGIYLVISFTAFFLVLVAPITAFCLRKYKDSYGIRNEIMVDIAVGIPCFILTIVWYTIFGQPLVTPWGEYFKTYFAPRNWLIFFILASHIMTIIIPLLRLSSRWHHIHHGKAHSSDGSSQPPSLASSTSNLHGNNNNDFNDRNNTRHSIRRRHRITRLRQTPETLEYLLESPDTNEELMRIAIQDFDSENVVFYKHYLKLVDKLHKSVIHKRHRSLSSSDVADTSVPRLHRLSSNDTLVVPPQRAHCRDSNSGLSGPTGGPNNPMITIVPPPCIHTVNRLSGSSGQSKKNIKHHSTLISTIAEDDGIYDMVIQDDGLAQEFIDLYRTYIVEDAPLQVNVSHRARKDLDDLLLPRIQNTLKTDNQSTTWKIPWSSKQQQQHSNCGVIESSHTLKEVPSIVSSFSSKSSGSLISRLRLSWCSKSVFPPSLDYNNATVIDMPAATPGTSNNEQEKPSPLHLTLGMFEPVRNEVFWNIFAGVFPKYVNEFNKVNA